MNTRFSHISYTGLLVVFCLVFSASYLIPYTSYLSAQSIPASISGIVLEPSIENPAPGQQVTVTVQSYSIDINAATISWTVNGKVVLSGIGATKLQVVAPELGKSLTISLTAKSAQGTLVSGSTIVTSGSIDMILETDGYVPPFFRGKISPRYQNAVKITAIPHLGNATGGEYDPKTLVYTWKKNDKVLQDQNGYGKQSIILTGDIVPRPYDVTVTVAARDSGAQSQGTISIAAGSPTIGFYIDDPLYGPLWNRAMNGSVSIGSEKETTVLSVPYGFNKPIGEVGNLNFTWLINNIKRAELSAKESVVLRAPEGAAGSSNVRLDIRNSDKILQGAYSAFSASFSGSPVKDTLNDVAF